MSRRVVAQPLLKFGKRFRSGEIEMERGEPEIGDVSVRVDEAGHQRAAVLVDNFLNVETIFFVRSNRPDDLPIVIDKESSEALNAAV